MKWVGWMLFQCNVSGREGLVSCTPLPRGPPTVFIMLLQSLGKLLLMPGDKGVEGQRGVCHARWWSTIVHVAVNQFQVFV